jgi:hypothetical protein
MMAGSALFACPRRLNGCVPDLIRLIREKGNRLTQQFEIFTTGAGKIAKHTEYRTFAKLYPWQIDHSWFPEELAMDANDLWIP